jgi:tetratricopeptide (TPR) repeat protein
MADDFVKMLDEEGKEVKVPRKQWIEEILPQSLKQAWDDPDTLYAMLVAALNENVALAIMKGVRRLAEIGSIPEQPAVLEGVALMQAGQRDKAEGIFNVFLESHGPTASILTNLAKIQHERGEKTQAEETLAKALALDANLEHLLIWHLSLLKQRGGDEAAQAALRQLAEDPKNWRARMFIARALLKARRNGEALAAYKRAITEGDVSPDGLAQITSDLGRAALPGEMIDMVLPMYEARKHGPLAGINLLQAMMQSGRLDEAEGLLANLNELKHPMLQEILADFAGKLAKAREQPKPAPPPTTSDGAVRVGAVPIGPPLWSVWLNKPRWLIAPPEEGAVKVAIFSLSDSTRLGDGQGDASGLARALPLYLAESLRLRTSAATIAVIPVAPRVGPATVGAPWPLPQMLASCPPEFQPDYVVCGTLARGSRGTRVELHVFRVKDKEPLKTLRVPVADDFRGAGEACVTQLTALLAGAGVQERTPLLSAAADSDGYLACLGHLFIQTLTAGGMLDMTKLPSDSALLENCFALAEADEASPLPLLTAAASVAAAMRYGSSIVDKYKQRLLDLIVRRADKMIVARRIGPAVFKLLGKTELLASANAQTLAPANSQYAEWLAALQRG